MSDTANVACTCRTTDTYRQLDQDCPTHGTLAEIERLSAGIDRAVAQISAKLDELEQRFNAWQASSEEEVRTRRLVVVDEAGTPVIYSEMYDDAVQLVVEHRQEREGGRRHSDDNLAMVTLHAGHESACEAGWNATIDGEIAAAAMAFGGDRAGGEREITSYLTLMEGDTLGAPVNWRHTRELHVEPSGVETCSGPRVGRGTMRARAQMVIIDGDAS